MDKNYTRTVIYSTDAFEIVSCEWVENAISPMHDHGFSACYVLIQEGRFLNNSIISFRSETQTLSAGEVLFNPPGSSHEFRCISDAGKTLHVYVPRIQTKEGKLKWSISQSEINTHLDLALNENAISINELKKQLDSVAKLSLPTDSPFFMNQLFSGIFPQTVIAQEIINQTRTTMATSEASPVFSQIEKKIIFELGKIIGWDKQRSSGVSVAGGSAANFMALHCARHRLWPETKQNGMANLKPRLYISEDAHYSFQKGAAALGFGSNSACVIPVNSSHQMDHHHLEKHIQADLKSGLHPFLIAATTGTTVYGAFDPLEELSAIARKYNLWLHADAAWGAPAIFSKTARYLVSGIHLADSMTFDSHKFFGSNLTNSLFLTQHPDILFSANDVKGGEYLFHETEDMDRGRMSWQCGRGPDILSFWALWKHLGTNGMSESIDRQLEIKQEVIGWIRDQKRLHIVADSPFLNICVEIEPPSGGRHPAWSKHVRNTLINNGHAMVNYSSDKTGSTFLRLLIVHPQISIEHIKHILNCALEVQ